MTRLHLYADESGNFDFSHGNGASKYFMLGTLMIDSEEKVAALQADLTQLHRQLQWDHSDKITGPFHACEDKQAVRDAVYDVLMEHDWWLDVTILQKTKAQPHLRVTQPTFYKYAWFYHFKYLAPRQISREDELLVVAGSVGTKKMRAAFHTAVSSVIAQCAPTTERRISCLDTGDQCLSAVDYALWAVQRKWELRDERSYKIVKDRVRTEFDLFAPGRIEYY